MDSYQNSRLWIIAFPEQPDGLTPQRQRLITAYEQFRERVGHLLALISKELPDLTVHDITHVDQLWQVASEIAGQDCPLNPAEAFVLGGAFLLHDAAHCRAVFQGGLDEIKGLTEWKDAAAQRGFDPETLAPGSEAFQTVLFDTLRVLHPKQARRLPFVEWKAPGETTPQYLLPDEELRQAYGAVIGEIAESHWWHPHQLETLAKRTINAPVCLPNAWEVDMLKIAALLRTADAAHLDSKRAPNFLYALTRPTGISRLHWHFQSKLHQAKTDPERQELRITGQAFQADEQEAWWLAYDAARMVDGELRAVDHILRDHQRPRFAARSLADAHSPEDFARHVPTHCWQPVDAGIKVTDVKSLVERFGGERLYGDKPWLALRELLQNARDAVEACRALGGLGPEEGEIEVALESTPEGDWLHVTDTGIGMSRYVLTSVLLDFGRSLWRSADLRGEWAGLASSGFEAVGQFGIGFFSVFMLGNEVKVLTRRYRSKGKGKDKEDEDALLHFPNATASRPVLLTPEEGLPRHGTRVSVRILPEKQGKLTPMLSDWEGFAENISLAETCAQLAPALSINLYIKDGSNDRQCVVWANDWLKLDAKELILRISPRSFPPYDDFFGPWSHLELIYTADNKRLGRCAIAGSHFRGGSFCSLSSCERGIGVIGGINVGMIDGLVGLVQASNQQDLARQTPIPAFSLAVAQKFAKRQKQLLLKANKLNFIHSEVFAALGCSYSGLIVAKHDGVELSFEALQEKASEFNEFYIHIGEVNDDYYNYFTPIESLIETSVNSDLKWTNKLYKRQIDTNPYSLKDAIIKALKLAWGGVKLSEKTVVVGSYGDIKEPLSNGIHRFCIIASRPTPPDGEEPI